jgi:hypothetical protein
VEDTSNVCRRYHAVSTRLAKKWRKRKREEVITLDHTQRRREKGCGSSDANRGNGFEVLT